MLQSQHGHPHDCNVNRNRSNNTPRWGTLQNMRHKIFRNARGPEIRIDSNRRSLGADITIPTVYTPNVDRTNHRLHGSPIPHIPPSAASIDEALRAQLAHAIILLYNHVHGCRRTVELRSGGYEVGGSRWGFRSPVYKENSEIGWRGAGSWLFHAWVDLCW